MHHGTIEDEMPKSELNEQEFPVKQAEREEGLDLVCTR